MRNSEKVQPRQESKTTTKIAIRSSICLDSCSDKIVRLHGSDMTLGEAVAVAFRALPADISSINWREIDEQKIKLTQNGKKLTSSSYSATVPTETLKSVREVIGKVFNTAHPNDAYCATLVLLNYLNVNSSLDSEQTPDDKLRLLKKIIDEMLINHTGNKITQINKIMEENK